MHTTLRMTVFCITGWFLASPGAAPATYLDTLIGTANLVLHSRDLAAGPQASAPAQKAGLTGPTVQGFRVQCFASSQIERARAEKKTLESRLPGQNVYLVFMDPYYKLHVGDYTSREAAEKVQADLKNLGYRDSWIVRTRITSGTSRQ